MVRIARKYVTLGQTFGAWTVASDDVRRTSNNSTLVLVRCSCGVEKYAQLSHLRHGMSNSCEACGSKRRVKTLDQFLADTPAKKQLRNRINVAYQRCTNPKHKEYSYYGGRGIEFRFDSVKDFAEYILRVYPLDSYTGWELDRTENNGHYERGNIRLATKSTNMMNRRSSKLSMELRAWLRAGDSYSRTQIGRLLDTGMSSEAIMQRYNNSKEIA